MKQQDLRTPNQIFDDMLADDHDLDKIAARLGWSPLQIRSHYLKVCREMGIRPDEE